MAGWFLTIILNTNILPLKGDTLTLTTWIESYSGVKCERKTEIYRKKDHKLVAKAKTLWCFIDLHKQKPQRIQPEISEPFFEL